MVQLEQVLSSPAQGRELAQRTAHEAKLIAERQRQLQEHSAELLRGAARASVVKGDDVSGTVGLDGGFPGRCR